MKRICLVIRTSYDVYVKPTYALRRKERTDIIRLIVRSFFVKLAPGQRGEPGLVDRVLVLHAGSRWFDSHRGHISEQFFRSNRPGYPHPVSSELENSGIRGRSMIAVSLNVGGGGVRLIKPAKLCMCTQTLQTQRGRTHGAGCVRQWFRTAEPLGERRY